MLTHVRQKYDKNQTTQKRSLKSQYCTLKRQNGALNHQNEQSVENTLKNIRQQIGLDKKH
jgi:hypothetical protein